MEEILRNFLETKSKVKLLLYLIKEWRKIHFLHLKLESGGNASSACAMQCVLYLGEIQTMEYLFYGRGG